MSKSDDSDYSRINLTDDADAIAQKIRKAKTDPAPLPDSEKGLEGRPEAENLINIYAALAEEPRARVIAQFAGQQFSGFKNALAELAVAKLTPLAAEMRRLLADPAEIDRILDTLPDPAGQFYRFNLAKSLLRAARPAWRNE
jgi:tryptophanyl-tRNA synthetase